MAEKEHDADDADRQQVIFGQSTALRNDLIAFIDARLAQQESKRLIATIATGDVLTRLLMSDASEQPGTTALSLALLDGIRARVMEAAGAAAVIAPNETRH